MDRHADARFSLVVDAWPGSAGESDAVERRELPLAGLADSDHILSAAYDYWRAKSRPPHLPSRGDIDILEISHLIKFLHIVDVSDDDPSEWFFRIIGAVVPRAFGWSVGRDRVSDCPWPVLKQAIVEDYGTVRATANPLYQEVALRLDNRVYEYARLLLPLAADGHRVDTLISCVFLRATPELQV